MTWYIARDGTRAGPYSHHELVKLVGDGQLKSDDLVWKAGLINWTRAAELDGLFVPPPLDDSTHSSETSGKPEPRVRQSIAARMSSFIARHWRGELSADDIFWRVIVLTSIIHNFTIGTLDRIATDVATNLAHYRLFSALSLAFLPITIGLVTWQTVGTWRHAAKLESQPAKIICQIFVILWIVCVFAVFRNAKPSFTDRVQVAIGDPYLSDWKLSVIEAAGKKHLYLRGPLGVGVSDQVKRALETDSEVKSIVLDSAGGRVGEGLLLYSLLSESKITAHINWNCEGACVIAYLGAPVRSATQGSKIVFQCTPIGNECLSLSDLRRRFPYVGYARVNWESLGNFSNSEQEQLPSMSELQSSRLVHFVTDHPTSIEYDQVFVDPDNGDEYTFDEVDWAKQGDMPVSEQIKKSGQK